jgi:hypothetical protein
MKTIVFRRAAAVITLALTASLPLRLATGWAAAPGFPAAYTGAASQITYSSATLEGYVNPKGQGTSYYFIYGPTASYGSSSPVSSAGSGTTSTKVSQAIADLQAGTTYHFRLVATGPAGTNSGADRTFATPAIPLSLRIAAAPNPVVFGNAFFIDGTLSGTNAANRAVQLQETPYPYLAGFANLGNPELVTAAGSFSFPVLGLSTNTQFRVQAVGSPTAVSSVLIEGVAVRLTLHARGTRRRGIYRLFGTVTPRESGAHVRFQLLAPGRGPVNLRRTAPLTSARSTFSRFSALVDIRHPGYYRALVTPHDGDQVSNHSAPLLLR